MPYDRIFAPSVHVCDITSNMAFSCNFCGEQCTAGACGALHPLTIRASNALLDIGCIRAGHNAQNLHAECSCIKLYLPMAVVCAYAVYTTSTLPSALFNYSVQYICNFRCPFHMRCKLEVHSLVSGHTVKTYSACTGE